MVVKIEMEVLLSVRIFPKFQVKIHNKIRSKLDDLKNNSFELSCRQEKWSTIIYKFHQQVILKIQKYEHYYLSKVDSLIKTWQSNVCPRFEPFKHQPHKMVKHTVTIWQLLPTNCLNVFDHFAGLAFKGLGTFLFPKYLLKY